LALPLNGIRVIDLGRIFAAPWCTQLLGDLGAEIIKIEHPEKGDDFRTYGPPFLVDKSGKPTRESAYYLSANRNKKSVALDLATDWGQRVIRELVTSADVLIENFKVEALKKYGLDYASLAKLRPQIIYCSVSGFGQTGPFAHRGGLDSVIQALSGLMSLTGEPDGEPQKVGMIVDDFAAGMYAAVGILAALRHREVNGGQGQYIDISLLDCGLAMLGPRLMTYLISGEIPQRNGNASFGSAPAQTFRCSDGTIMVQAGSNDQFRRLCHAIERPELVDDPRFGSRSDRVKHIPVLIPALQEIFMRRTVKQWQRALEAAGVLNAPINTVPEALAHEQVEFRQMVRTIPHPVTGTIATIANPIRLSETPLTEYRTPPMLGEHTGEVLASLGLSKSAGT